MYKKRDYILVVIIVLIFVQISILVVENKSVIGTKAFTAMHSPSLASAIDPLDAKLEMAIGEYYFTGDGYDAIRAEYHFRNAVAIDPKIEGGHYQLARLAFLRGDFDEAMTDIDEHIKDHPWYSRNYYMKGLVAGFKKDYPTSIEAFRTYVKLDPNYWAGFNDLAWVELASGDYEGALTTVDSVIPHMGEVPWLMNSRGLALMNLSRDREALIAFKSAKAGFLKWGPAGWGKAYPGNDPAIYNDGYEATLSAVDANIALIQSKVANKK